jgi:hypothetical protein
VASTDLRKELATVVKAYIDLEQKSNPYIAKYEVNYAPERKKTLATLLDIVSGKKVFSGNTGSIESYLATVKHLEQKTGRRILPWDVLTTNYFDHLMQNNYFTNSKGQEVSQNYLAQLVPTDEGDKSKFDVLKGMINSILKAFPSESFDLEIISKTVNQTLEQWNSQVNQQITGLQQQRDELVANKTVTNAATTDTQITEIDDQIAKLQNALFDVKLAGSFFETYSGQKQFTQAQSDRDDALAKDAPARVVKFLDEVVKTNLTYNLDNAIQQIQAIFRPYYELTET